MSTDTVTISTNQYLRLVEAELRLSALEAAGVDNWEGRDHIDWSAVMGDVDTCSVCGRPYVVKADGTLRWHLDPPSGSTYRDRYGRGVCSGAGKPPAPTGGSSTPEEDTR